MKIPRIINVTERTLPEPNQTINLPASTNIKPPSDTLLPPTVVYDFSPLGGDGLTYNDGDLSVNVDSSTIEINSDTLRVKDLGITNAKIATGIDAIKLADGSVNNTKLQYINSVTSNVQTQLDGKEPTITAGLDFQVYTTQSGSKSFRDPTQIHTCNFTHTTALGVGSTGQGVYGIIHSGVSFKVPAGKTMVVLSILASLRTGSTAGTYTLSCGVLDKTNNITYELERGSSSTLSSQIHMYIEGTFSSGLVELSENTTWNLYTKNESTSPAAAGTLNSVTITYYYL
jgi:hypothetical protein